MRVALVLTLLLLAATGATAGEIVITGARLEPVSGPAVEPAVIVVKDGKIKAVGPAEKVEIPRGARRIDARGKTVIPGLVNPYGRLGTGGSRPAGGTTPHLTPRANLDPGSRDLARVLAAGFTTIVVTREGRGVPGTGLAIRTMGDTVDELVVVDPVCLRMTGGIGTSVLKVLSGALANAKKELDAVAKYEKDLAAYKKAEAEFAKKVEEAKKKKEKEPERPKDLKEPKEPKISDRTEMVRKAVAGELPLFVRVTSATDLLHFEKLAEPFSKLKVVILFEGADAYRSVELLAKRKWSVVLTPRLSTAANTRVYRNVPAELAAAGVPFALHPYPDSVSGHEELFLALGRLVRAGLERGKALSAVTLDAARIAGLEKKLGSIEKGKVANLLVFSGDPFEVNSRVETVILDGRIVFPEVDR